MANGTVQPSPFVPGSGRSPPYLAGREAERHALQELLAYLRVGEGASADAVLSGPRGNGKTTLLYWFQQEVTSTSPRMDAVWMTPSDVQSLDALATHLVPPRRFWTLRSKEPSLSLRLGKVGCRIAGCTDALASLLAARCRRRPLVLLVDEAHTLELGVGQALLNASQTVRRDSPFLLVMAGTPGLQHHLNMMAATFWSRAEKLGIGRLEDEAAAAALVRPFASETPSVGFDGDALTEVLASSQGYPYFLQLWGRELWRAKGGATCIDRTLVQAARPAVEASKVAYYEDRRRVGSSAATYRRVDGRPSLRRSSRLARRRTGRRHRHSPRRWCAARRSPPLPGCARGHWLRLEATRSRRCLGARYSEPHGLKDLLLASEARTGKLTPPRRPRRRRIPPVVE